jgi:hypothetical protein
MTLQHKRGGDAGFGIILFLLLPAIMQCRFHHIPPGFWTRLLFSKQYDLVEQCKDVLFFSGCKTCTKMNGHVQ